MKVILRADIVNVGKQGEIRSVAPGFARNYLLPKKLALEATDQNLKVWEREKKLLEKQREQVITDAKALAADMEKTSFTIPVKVGDAGKLFGSVTSANIARVLGENGFAVDKHAILLADPIKEVGVYTIDLRLHPEVIAKAKVWVVEEKKEESSEEKE